MKTSPTKGGWFDWALKLLLGSGPQGPEWQMDGETMEQCRRRLGLPDNRNPAPRPDWVRPPAPQAPPHRNPGPINLTEPGKGIPVGFKRADGSFFVGFSSDPEFINEMNPTDFSKVLEENERLTAENKSLQEQLRQVKCSEGALARRAECLRKKWPAIYKTFFATGRNAP